MDFTRRIKLFGFGFIIGMIILLYIFGKRGCKGVNHMKVDELISQYTIWSPKAQCKRKALGIEVDTVYFKTMSRFRVNYDKSDVRAEPCGIYRLEPMNRDSGKFEITICDCDTVSRIDDIDLFVKNNSCDSISK
ncbi:MAG: hypothetical protein ACK5AY_04870 [Bacteroidota bacterium]|jgi:hypothetical protein